MDPLLIDYSLAELIKMVTVGPNNPFLYKDGRALYSIEDILELDDEEFKDHVYYPIKVSNLGRIMQNNKIIHQFPDSTKRYPIEYLQVTFLNSTNRFKTEYVYKLVAEVWCPNPNRDLYTDIHHIDNNGTKNTSYNLVWLTCEQHAEIHPFMKNLSRYKEFLEKSKPKI